MLSTEQSIKIEVERIYYAINIQKENKLFLQEFREAFFFCDNKKILYLRKNLKTMEKNYFHGLLSNHKNVFKVNERIFCFLISME